MNCRICLEPVTGESAYHPKCLTTMFGPRCQSAHLAKTRRDLVSQMPRHVAGFSISGLQPKAQLCISENKLALCHEGGSHILKPSPEQYPGVAENEHATLCLMAAIGMDVPLCGLLELDDSEQVFVIQRFDRDLQGHPLPLQIEDAMQALGFLNLHSATKYNAASYLDVLNLAQRLGGRVLVRDLFERLVFSYLIGNDDHHLKNISFVYDKERRTTRLSPAYDVLSSAIHTEGAGSIMALALLSNERFPENEPPYFRDMANGHYSGGDFLVLGEKAGLPRKVALKIIEDLPTKVQRKAPGLIAKSFMARNDQNAYLEMIERRARFLSVIDHE